MARTFTARKGGRLTPEDWRDAALQQIADGGVESVNLNVIAENLGVTKGGFYWHFKGRDALLMSALQEWARCDSRTPERLEAKGGTAKDRLSNLLKLCLQPCEDMPGGALEMAFREWARTNDEVMRVVKSVQKARVKYVKSLYQQMGLDEEDAEAYAVGFLAHVMGQTIIASTATNVDARRRFERSSKLLIDGIDKEFPKRKAKSQSRKTDNVTRLKLA